MRFSVTGRRNCAVVGGEPYVYARAGSASFVMHARCPHRGGPLHLASVSPKGNRLVCPWHNGGVSLARLRRVIPAVRTGQTVTAVIPAPPDSEVALRHLPMSADLACPA